MKRPIATGGFFMGSLLAASYLLYVVSEGLPF
jgi:hypothetical protein